MSEGLFRIKIVKYSVKSSHNIKTGKKQPELSVIHRQTFQVCCLTTITPGLCCCSVFVVAEVVLPFWVCWRAWNLRNGFISTCNRVCEFRFVSAKGTSWLVELLELVPEALSNKLSPSKCLIASTMVSKFCLDVLVK